MAAVESTFNYTTFSLLLSRLQLSPEPLFLTHSSSYIILLIVLIVIATHWRQWPLSTWVTLCAPNKSAGGGGGGGHCQWNTTVLKCMLNILIRSVKTFPTHSFSKVVKSDGLLACAMCCPASSAHWLFFRRKCAAQHAYAHLSLAVGFTQEGEKLL